MYYKAGAQAGTGSRRVSFLPGGKICRPRVANHGFRRIASPEYGLY